MLQPIVLGVLGSTSVALFALTVVALPLILTRMPTDFFSRPERRRLELAERDRPFRFVILRGLKNALGGVLLLLGLLMLIVPGQGLVTIFVALFLLDFPGKRRLQRWVISRPVVHRPVNALRRRAGRPALELPSRA
ncbi:PGPGW domain-containing protein [Anaeromyxobacter sp. K]|uniref:PGPGW domain-containing protein n=1 Tax=Anaeromyxobacter sp. (strain K) TaxID=447217 RepID=UPI00015F869E|nr:PGPGW domain-containing protein [Anaeromyxobacter sp. K]